MLLARLVGHVLPATLCHEGCMQELEGRRKCQTRRQLSDTNVQGQHRRRSLSKPVAVWQECASFVNSITAQAALHSSSYSYLP